MLLSLIKLDKIGKKGVAEEFQERGYSSIAFAISRHHGGFPTFREKLRKLMGAPSEQDRLEGLLDDYSGGENE